MFNIIIILLIHLINIVIVFTSVCIVWNAYWEMAFGVRRESGPLMEGCILTLNEYRYFTEMVVICDWKVVFQLCLCIFTCLVVADIPQSCGMFASTVLLLLWQRVLKVSMEFLPKKKMLFVMSHSITNCPANCQTKNTNDYCDVSTVYFFNLYLQ